MIAEKAMLVAVHISVWTATKHDKDVSRKVADQHGAHESAGRYNKKLLQQAAKLDALRTLAGQIRTHVYKITLPWSDEGYRILREPVLSAFGANEGLRAAVLYRR
jgi:hypothetical protein